MERCQLWHFLPGLQAIQLGANQAPFRNLNTNNTLNNRPRLAYGLLGMVAVLRSLL